MKRTVNGTHPVKDCPDCGGTGCIEIGSGYATFCACVKPPVPKIKPVRDLMAELEQSVVDAKAARPRVKPNEPTSDEDRRPTPKPTRPNLPKVSERGEPQAVAYEAAVNAVVQDIKDEAFDLAVNLLRQLVLPIPTDEPLASMNGAYLRLRDGELLLTVNEARFLKQLVSKGWPERDTDVGKVGTS
jgi:hypothetical protein